MTGRLSFSLFRTEAEHPPRHPWRFLSVLGCLPLLGAFTACGTQANSPGGQTGSETLGCLPVTTRALAEDEPSALGFSAHEVLASLGEVRREKLTYADGSATTLTVRFTYGDGPIEFQDREYVSNGSGADVETQVAATCNDVVSIDGQLSFETDDGAFDEAWPVSLLAETANSGSLFYDLDLQALNGTYTVTELDPNEFDTVSAYLSLKFNGSTLNGEITGQASQSHGSGPGGAVSARNFSIATF